MVIRAPSPSPRFAGCSGWPAPPASCSRAAVVDRDRVLALVARITGKTDVDALTRAEVQDVYDALDELIAQQDTLAPAASA